MSFRFHKTLDIITLFHSPKSAASQSILKFLRHRAAAASDHTQESSTPVFQLDVQEAPPTRSQLQTIANDLLGGAGKKQGISDIVRGAKDVNEAVNLVEKDAEASLVRPLVVDWNNGRVVVGDNESKVKELIDSLPK